MPPCAGTRVEEHTNTGLSAPFSCGEARNRGKAGAALCSRGMEWAEYSRGPVQLTRDPSLLTSQRSAREQPARLIDHAPQSDLR